MTLTCTTSNNFVVTAHFASKIQTPLFEISRVQNR